MVKHTQTIRRQFADGVFGHIMGLALKGLTSSKFKRINSPHGFVTISGRIEINSLKFAQYQK